MTDITLPGLTPSEDVIAAERSVVGAAIGSRPAAEIAADVLTAADFWDGPCRFLFEAVLDLLTEGGPVDHPAVLGALNRSGNLSKVGGGVALANLISWAAVGPAVRHHAETVAADADRRRMLLALHSAARIPADRASWEPARDIDHIRALVDRAAAPRIGDQDDGMLDDLNAILDEIDDPPAKLAGVRPPYIDLEALMTAWTPGQLITVGARPGVGKTTLAQDAIRRAALADGIPTVMFSLEMTRREVLTRLLSAEARVSAYALKPGSEVKPTTEEMRRLVNAQSRIANAPLHIRYMPGCSLEQIRGYLRTMARKQPAGFVVVDYLQLMAEPKGDNREQRVAANIRGLKQIAQQFETPLMCLSQLNRLSTQRSDKRPQMSDLRESGSTEQDSDIVILIHREDAHERESPRAGEVDLLVEKHRGGPAQVSITVASQLHYARFADMAPDHTAPAGRANLRAV